MGIPNLASDLLLRVVCVFMEVNFYTAFLGPKGYQRDCMFSALLLWVLQNDGEINAIHFQMTCTLKNYLNIFVFFQKYNTIKNQNQIHSLKKMDTIIILETGTERGTRRIFKNHMKASGFPCALLKCFLVLCFWESLSKVGFIVFWLQTNELS